MTSSIKKSELQCVCMSGMDLLLSPLYTIVSKKEASDSDFSSVNFILKLFKKRFKSIVMRKYGNSKQMREFCLFHKSLYFIYLVPSVQIVERGRKLHEEIKLRGEEEKERERL